MLSELRPTTFHLPFHWRCSWTWISDMVAPAFLFSITSTPLISWPGISLWPWAATMTSNSGQALARSVTPEP